VYIKESKRQRMAQGGNYVFRIERLALLRGIIHGGGGQSVFLKYKQTLTTKNACLAESSNKGILPIDTVVTDDVGTVH
jgi:hypothetical protein